MRGKLVRGEDMAQARTDMRARILGSISVGVAALGLAACGTSTNIPTDTTNSSPKTTTAVVTQTVIKTDTVQAQPKKPATKPKVAPAPAPTTTTTAAPAPATTQTPAPTGPIMPNVVGKDLDTATGELRGDGIQYSLNSDGEHVILQFDWGICSTQPAAGQHVTGVVVLNLGHFSCGA